jgi:hypothetical protein
MSFDQNNPYGYGVHPSNPNGGFVAPQNVQAKISMPNAGQLGGAPGRQVPPWIRFPFYPTSPFVSTNPSVGSSTRLYGVTLLSTDNDFVIGTESIRNVQFDIPVRIIAILACCTDTVANATNAAPTQNFTDSWLFRMEYTTGDQFTTAARLASTCTGTAENPFEVGGSGYNVDQGASLLLGITPQVSLTGIHATNGVRIDITLVCLEIRGNRNFVG